MAFETILYEKKGRIVYITINRPETLNALNMQAIMELSQAWRDFEKDASLWVSIVTGAGEKAMCSGFDVKDAVEREKGGESYSGKIAPEPVEGYPAEIWGPRRNEVSKPVIAAINGICCGGGLDFVTESDIAICSENATFFDPHVSIGWVSSHEMIQMSRRIPLGLTMRMALMGRQERLSAQRAYEIGLISEVVPLPRLMDRATEIARMLLENAPLAMRGTKRAILKGLALPLPEAIALGDNILRNIEETEDHAEGPLAFAEKRRPQWKGR